MHTAEDRGQRVSLSDFEEPLLCGSYLALLLSHRSDQGQEVYQGMSVAGLQPNFIYKNREGGEIRPPGQGVPAPDLDRHPRKSASWLLDPGWGAHGLGHSKCPAEVG